MVSDRILYRSIEFYVLAKGTQHEITSLQSQQGFVELVRHSRAMSLINAPEFVAAHMRLCSELISNVSLCSFTRKPSLADLPKLIGLVEDDLAQIQEIA